MSPHNDTTRRFPRTLQEAFPVSEGLREGIEPPQEPSPTFWRTVDAVCYLLAALLLAWLAWATLRVPG